MEKDMQSGIGRPSIDPAIPIKFTVVQYTFGILSIRFQEDALLDLE
ncbi:hypothetical protein MKX62_24515 [Sporosarcina sp. FSL K6-5500]